MSAPQARHLRVVEPQDQWLTAADVARALRVSRKTVYRAIWSGDLHADRFGRALRIRRSDLVRFLNSARTS